MIEFPNGWKTTAQQIIGLAEINIFYRAGLWESQSEIRVES